MDKLLRLHFSRRHGKLAVMNTTLAAHIALNGHVIRRISDDEIGFAAAHQRYKGRLIKCTPADKLVLPGCPKIARATDSRAWRDFDDLGFLRVCCGCALNDRINLRILK